MANTPSTVWPVNELGEIVLANGKGTTNVVGFVNEGFIPTTPDNTVPAVSLDSKLSAIKPRAIPLSSFGTRPVATGLSGINWRRTMEAPCEFDLVRAVFANASVNPVTVNGTVGAMSSMADPSTIDGTIVPLTFNAATTGVVPIPATGREYVSSRTADNGLACLTNEIASDWVLCPSVPRTDGGTLPAIGITFREVEAVAGSITRANIEGASSFNSIGITRKEYTFTKTGGDATASGSGTGWVATAAGSQLFPAVWLEVLSRNKARVVMGSGDSTVYGTGSTIGNGGTNSWGLRGCALASETTYPCVWVNAAWPGSQHKHWTATDIPGGTSLTVAGNAGVSQFEHNLAIYKPTDVVILTWSTNDAATPTTPTQAEMRREFGRAMYMAKLASDYGARVIFCTPFPRGSLTATGGANLTAYTSYVRSQISPENLFDIHAIVGDGTGGWAAGMNADDSHPNDVGHGLLGQKFAEFLSKTRQ